MTRKLNKVQYELNPCKYSLNHNEIRTIIRGAEDVVYLEFWKQHDYKKVQAKINNVINHL